jgi:hypothetical protein
MMLALSRVNHSTLTEAALSLNYRTDAGTQVPYPEIALRQATAQLAAAVFKGTGRRRTLNQKNMTFCKSVRRLTAAKSENVE